MHSEQITERALKATQTASQLVFAERLKELAIESYDSKAESCNRQRASIDLNNTQPCQGIDTARAITNSSFARLSPQPRRPADAGASFHVPEQDKPKFEEAIYSKLPRVGVPRPSEDADMLWSLFSDNENKAMSGRLFQQYLAATAAYQHQQITGVPLQSSLVNSQGWCRSIRISAITKDIGVQSSEEAIAKDLIRRCNRIVPGVILSFPQDKIKTYNFNGTTAYQLEPQVNPKLVPQQLAQFKHPHSPLSQ